MYVDFFTWLVIVLTIIGFWGLIALVVAVIGSSTKGHDFHDPEHYSYNKDGSLRDTRHRDS